MNKTALFFKAAFLLGFIPGASLYSQVDQDELRNSQRPVEFINYAGPHARIDTRDQIRGIGASLGLAVEGGAERAGGDNRYFVIHSVSSGEDGKLNADIFGLGAGAGVDHVRNLRLIIQGYLETTYGYSAADGALLAQFITVYNAVYRGNWNYFSGRYKTPVLRNISREKAGLSTRFDEWPGQTLMLIPMGTVLGGLSSVDTGSLTSEDVINELRKNGDMGLPERKEMVGLMEREAQEAERRATEQRNTATEGERNLARDRQEAARERDDIARERERNQAAKSEGAISEDQSRRNEEALAQREREAEEREREFQSREEDLARQNQEAEKNEELAERKTSEAQDAREDIARDQQLIINREDRDQGAVPEIQRADGILGLTILDSASGLGRVVRLNPSNGQILRRSGLTTVSVRTFINVDGKFLAVAGENIGSGAIRIVEIDPRSLEISSQGEVDIYPQSPLWAVGSDLYALTVQGNSLYLGRFNTGLALQARSAIAVHPFATVFIQGDLLMTQRGDGAAVVLNAKDLTERK